MRDLVIYEENKIDMFSNKISYYKKLGVNHILVDSFTSVDENSVSKLFSICKSLAANDFKLIVTIDILDILKLLLREEDTIDWNVPKIRNSLYQFINYLTKYGINSFYFKNTDFLLKDQVYTREFVKNTLTNKEVLAIGETFTNNLSMLNFLSSSSYNNFSYIKINYKENNEFVSYKEYVGKIQGMDNKFDINYLLSIDNNFKNFLNYENFPYYSQTLLAATTYFLRGAVFLKDYQELGLYYKSKSKNDYILLKETNDNLSFFQRILSIRKQSKAIMEGKFRQIFDKDKDVFAYIRTYDNKKVVVFANFSQKEVMLDIRFHFIDLYDFTYLLGNYGRRKIVKNLLLRPYEFISFSK
jgi:hypothetical protein